MNGTALRTLSAALSRILRPLIRILLRHGVSYNSFADVAKAIYVDVAMSEFGIEGRKPSISRASVITGLTRKEVMRVRQNPRPEDQAMTEQYNRAARVISAWLRVQPFAAQDRSPPGRTNWQRVVLGQDPLLVLGRIRTPPRPGGRIRIVAIHTHIMGARAHRCCRHRHRF